MSILEIIGRNTKYQQVVDSVQRESPEKNLVSGSSAMLVFEKDVYPAFTSGENLKIIKALDSVTDLTNQSTIDADTVFRTMNWSWPLLTARARGTSADGIAILERFTRLIDTLLRNCSSSLIPSIAGCKNVLRAIVRGIGAINPEIALSYVQAVEDQVLGHKGTRGYFLDKAAVEQLIALAESTSDAELGVKTDVVLEKILCTRRLFSVEALIEFLVKLIKSKECNAEVSKMVSSVLGVHRSRMLYDSLMDKLGFIRLSTEESVLRKLTIINFYVGVIRAPCPGGHIPAAISKAELTSAILNWKSNKLVAAFVLRLCVTVLERFPTGFESATVRDKLVEMNSIVPVIKAVVSEPESPANLIILQQLVRLVVEFKRTFPGSFLECKFDWLKLIDDTNIPQVYLRTLIGLVASLNMHSTPITASIGRAWTRIMRIACDSKSELVRDDCFRSLSEWFREGSGKNLISTPDEGERFSKLIRKYSESLNVPGMVAAMFSTIVDRPQTLTNKLSESENVSILQLILASDALKPYLGEKDFARKLKRKRDSANEDPQEIEPKRPSPRHKQVDSEVTMKLPRVSLKNRWKCAPLPDHADVEDTYNLIVANWSTLLFANEFDAAEEPSINLIQLVGSNKLYHSILSLSSDNECVRASAYEVLSVVLRALAMSIEAKGWESNKFAFREAPQVAMVLTWVRNGITPPSEGESIPAPLPLISTVFVVEALKVMFDPKHVLYTAVFKHVLAKAAMNTTSDIQMWISLFFSTDGEKFRPARQWILDIVRIASQDQKSIDLMVRRGVIEAVVESTVQLNATADEFWTGIDIVQNILNTLPQETPEETAVSRLAFVRKYALSQWVLLAVHSKWLRFDD